MYNLVLWNDFQKKIIIINAKIVLVFSLFNFKKAITPKFLQHNAKNDGIFKVQFHKKKLALKIPNWVIKMHDWATKMLQLAKCCSIFVAKKLAFLTPKFIFSAFLHQ